MYFFFFNVPEFVSTTPRILLNSFNSFTLSFMSGSQKNCLEMIRPGQLLSVKSWNIWQLYCLIKFKHPYASIIGDVKFKIYTYSLMSLLAINFNLQSPETKTNRKTKKDATQPISTSKNNIQIVKLHAKPKHIIIHTICNCVVLLL